MNADGKEFCRSFSHEERKPHAKGAKAAKKKRKGNLTAKNPKISEIGKARILGFSKWNRIQMGCNSN